MVLKAIRLNQLSQHEDKMMIPSTRFLINKYLIPIIFLMNLSHTGFALQSNDSFFDLKIKENKILLNIQNSLAVDALVECSEILDFEFIGIENIDDRKITSFCESDSKEDLIGCVLHNADQRNFAFQYAGTILVSVIILPEGKSNSTDFSAKKDTVLATKVTGILKGSQAENIGLQAGDYIIEYDGHKIIRASDLRKKARKAADRYSVPMTVLSKGRKIYHTLEGGLIGIRIKTVRITPNALLGPY